MILIAVLRLDDRLPCISMTDSFELGDMFKEEVEEDGSLFLLDLAELAETHNVVEVINPVLCMNHEECPYLDILKDVRAVFH
jgi:hypothetical protein